MGIFGSVGRYLRTRGRLLYTEASGNARPHGKAKRGNEAWSKYLEYMEPRILLTALYGGETFEYAGSNGTVIVTLTGNVAAELVAAVQTGGLAGVTPLNVPADSGDPNKEGNLLFGDITGTITAGARSGTVLGNNSLPVSGGSQTTAQVAIPGLSYTSTGDQINVQGVASNVSGLTLAFNLYDVDSTGAVQMSNGSTQWTLQLLQLTDTADGYTGAATVLVTNPSTSSGAIVPLGSKNSAVEGGAFNPINGLYYFDVHTELPNAAGAGGTGGGTAYADTIYTYDTSTHTFAEVGTLNLQNDQNGEPQMVATGMAFVANPAAPTTGTLYVAEEPKGGGSTSQTQSTTIVPQLAKFTVPAGGGVTLSNPSSLNILSGFGTVRSPLAGVIGLTGMPASVAGGGSGYLFADVSGSAGSGQSLVRIDLSSGEGTVWGGATDLTETPDAQIANGAIDGQALTGLTYNPVAIDPYTGQFGAFMSVDSATGDLVFVNHKLRINQGDVYSVYSTVADINSAISFRSTSTLYTGGAGAINGVTTPATTGTVFLGFRGEIPDPNDRLNRTFLSNAVFLSGQLTNQIGSIPSLVADTTNPLLISSAPATNKLFAGLTVGKSLEQPYLTGGNLTDNLLGFRQASGLAISSAGKIAVMNSDVFDQATGDELGFVNATTGKITGLVTTVHLSNGTLLKNVEAMAYGDVDVNGDELLYAVYDLHDGNGPTLGWINIVTGVFTPIGSGLGLGANARVTAMAFTRGGTAADLTHESLYLAADPNTLDDDNSEALYQAGLSSGVLTGQVLNAPVPGPGGLITSKGGIGSLRDSNGKPVRAVSATFSLDQSGRLLVLDGVTGRIMDVIVQAGTAGGLAGTNVVTDAGSVNPTVAGIAYDPNTFQLLAVDNVTGESSMDVTEPRGSLSEGTESAVLMRVKDWTQSNADAVNMGRFLVDGVFTGKVYISGSLDTFYAGWIGAGVSSTSSSWLAPVTMDGSDSRTNGSAGSGVRSVDSLDNIADENYFQNNFYVEGDIRNVLSLTNIGSGPSTEITAGGKIGQVNAQGTEAAVVHAGDLEFIPNLTDSSSLNGFGGTTPYAFSINGGITVASDIAELTSVPNQAGSVFYNTPQPIETFTTNFTFNAEGMGGLAFVMQNESPVALGGVGNGLGYSGIQHSAALEFTLDPISGLGRIGFGTNGQINTSIVPTGIAFSEDDTIDATLTYDGSQLLVTLVDENLERTFSTSFFADLTTVLGGPSAYVGFTEASTGSSFIEISGFTYAGSAPGQAAFAQTEVEHFNVDSDYTFEAGFLTNDTGQSFIPFDNSSPAGAQYLGTMRNSNPGQPDVIHLLGDIDGAATNAQHPVNETTDYFAFGALAGQTLNVVAIPREDSSLGNGSENSINFEVIDPDGRVIASDESTWGGAETESREVTFVTDRPGVYMVEVIGPSNSNSLYELTIRGVGDDAIGGVVAKGQILLNGSSWVVDSDENTGSTVINPSIYADVGDIGAIVAGLGGTGTDAATGILAPNDAYGLTASPSPTIGYIITADSSEDIAVFQGNLRAVMGGAIGTVTGGSTSEFPDLLVNGTVGLLQTYPGSQVMAATMTFASTGDIQTLDSGGLLQGIYRTDKSIGNILAGSVVDSNDVSEFQVDVDRQGSDGIIDLIDVTGDWGSLNGGGIPIVTGPGGNVRFMNVGGTLYQDELFSTGLTGTRGEIVHQPGPVTLTDDTGATVVLNPGTVTTTTVSATGTLTTTSPGVLTTRTYGVRGAGGTVILDVDSTGGLTVNGSAGGSGRSVEIGTVQVAGPGQPITVTNGVPSVGPASSSANNVIIQSSGNTRVDVFNITDSGGTIDTISNTTGGDIVNVTAGDVGSIISQGNIGSMKNTTGAVLNPIAVFSNAYPFVDQHFGISANNIGLISAWGSIGNVLASGVIGTITPDAGQGLAGQFDGIDGPIVANGSAAATGNALTAAISIKHVDIGQGIQFAGSGSVSLAGIYAAGQIVSVTGTNADIRGAVVSENAIGNINLSGGSMIDARIEVVSSYGMASEIFGGTYTLTEFTQNIENPIYNINSITITGNGGIIGTQILAASLNKVSVSGFGIVSTQFLGVSDGTINNISADGLGLRAVEVNDAVVNTVTATGDGTFAALGDYSLSVRHSEADSLLDNQAGMAPNELTDLDVFINGDGIVSVMDPGGLQTGLIDGSEFFGQDSLGDVTAYTMLDSEFDFPRATGNLKANHDINDVQIVTGSVKSLNITHDALNLELTAAGKIGPVKIGGDFIVGTDSNLTPLSQIVAKGPSGDISNVSIGGKFDAVLQADSSLGSVTIGTAGVDGARSTGDYSGTIIVGGNHLPNAQFDLLKVFGDILSGVIDVVGNVGTIDIAHNFADLSGNTIINGDLNNLIVGDDPVVGASDLAAPITVTGNLGNVTITGKMSGNLTVQGNLGKFTLNQGTLTAGTPLLTGQLTVGGTLSSLTVPGPFSGTLLTGMLASFTTGGDLTGKIVGAEGIGALTISGNLVQGAQVISSLGGIQKLVVTGSHLDGSVTANKGTIGSLSVNGSIGALAVIAAQAIGTLAVPGLVMGSVSALSTISQVNVGGIAPGGVISGGIVSLTTTGDMMGTVYSGLSTSGTKFTIGHDLGGTSVFKSPATITVGNDVAFGALIESSSDLTSLTVKNSLNGDVLIDHTISAITAASMNGATVVGGLGIGSIKVTGELNNSVVATGLSRGVDGVYGTNDLGEQPRMADLTALSFGSMSESVVAASGNILGITTKGAITGSDISSGMALGGTNLAEATADLTPLADATDMANVLASPTLFHGNITKLSGTTLLSSDLTAGVSPGADGIFGTADDNVNTSLTGGASAILSAKVVADANSHLIANSSNNGATVVTYTLDGSGNSIVPGDPVSGSPAAVATTTAPGVITTADGTITVTVKGPTGTVVNLYDDVNTPDRLDTMVISAPSNSPVSVTIVGNSTTFNLGRVLTTDGTNLTSFIYNGAILGDVNGGPALWIDSDVKTLTVGSLPDDKNWSGQVGGNVSKMTINQLGSGQLRVGGVVSSLAISSSVGNPLLQEYATVNSSAVISEVTVNPSDGSIIATDGQTLLGTDFTSGAVTLTTAVTLPTSAESLEIEGIAFDASGTLFGVSTINNQNPTQLLGGINSSGDQLRGMAVDPLGNVYAIDSSSGVDTLVKLDPTTGAETAVGVITNAFSNTYSNSVEALTFDSNGNLFAILSDRDGGGSLNQPTDGVALGRITIASGLVRVSNPTANGQLPVLIAGGGVTDTFNGFAADNAGNLYAVRNVGGLDELDRLTYTGTGSLTTVALTTIGTVSVDGGFTGTNIVGMGFDESGNLIALNINGTNRELIDISISAPAQSVRLDTPGLLKTGYAAFGVAREGTTFKTYAYTTDPSTGGDLYTNPGVVPTLGVIATTGPTTGQFIQDHSLVQDASGTPLAGTLRSLAMNSNGELYVVMSNGEVFAYDTITAGTLVGAGAQGTIEDSNGQPLDVTQIMFTPGNQLVGLSDTGNNLVNINVNPQTIEGQQVLVATNLTDIGTANPANLRTLSYSIALGQFVSYDASTGGFAGILAASPATLGGLIAEGISSAALSSAFGERIVANGVASGKKGKGGSASSIGSIKISGAGTFTGLISADSTISTVAASGTVFDGGIVAHGDLTSLSVTSGGGGRARHSVRPAAKGRSKTPPPAITGGNIGSNAVIYADGSLAKISTSGDFSGNILGSRAGAIAIGGSGTAGSSITIDNDITSLTINGQEAGSIQAGSIGTLKIGGALVQGGSVLISGDAGGVTLSGGTEAGGAFMVEGNITGSLNVGGTLTGTIAVRQSIGSAVLASANSGLLDVGGSIKSLTVNGDMTDSLISVGTWIGKDGVYNTADDVIFGGGINTAKINGVFTDSVIAAGVLPRIGAAAGANNIPTDMRSFTGNASASNVADISSAEAGGIYKSVLGTITFKKPVISTVATGSTFSVVVAADGITKLSNKGTLKQAVLSDPAGAPQVATVTDPITGTIYANITFFSGTEMRIAFDQPLDTATINANTFILIDADTGKPVSDIYFGYFTQIGPDGQTQGVVQIFSPSGFNGASTLKLTLAGGTAAPTIADITGLRSALADFDQDGTPDATGDPFGTTFTEQDYILGPPLNDNFANAIALAGALPIVTSGSNIDASVELSETVPVTGGASVWWTWTATSAAPVNIGTAGSDFENVVAVYTGDSVDTLQLVKIGSGGLASDVSFIPIAGQKYDIVVYGLDAGSGIEEGNIQLTISNS